MIRLALSSVAEIAVVPMQDVLGLDSRARMNVPGRSEGNWGWRMTPGATTRRITNRLADLTALFGRWNGEIPESHDLHRRPARNLHARVVPESTHVEQAPPKTEQGAHAEPAPAESSHRP
jgi:4-alpha-glucanotransferase